jgi:geranyl-CoA carboxylase alpha subunit
VTALPFTRVLIANRGEIARRIIRSAKAMGLQTVAVYSEADRGALHVREADAAVCIGAAAPAASYLNIASIVAAAKASGAGAVHPGYGFLAENAAFAQACTDAGLVFVGPPASAIVAMGDKAAAKQLMKRAGVAYIPGFDGIQDEATLAAAANKLGYPVMIKAAAGGGGRGMRRVENAADFSAALRSARSEAENAFGNGELILELALNAPRHIEIQVFADSHGNVIHLGERDCSVQRRHQKIIEETPSPAVSAELRERMGTAAINAAKSIGYVGAGTVEFLLDKDGEFFFMEMNTRLQVEHAVTEAITGLDLVAMQLRVAAGEPLGLAQKDVKFFGHAIEVRLCAEDPAQDFLPQSGEVRLWHAPKSVRVDHALESGTVVPPFYDSMLAKFVAHGDTRDLARTRLIDALEHCSALGIATNRSFLIDCLRNEAFAKGQATTDFVSRFFPPETRAAAVPDAGTLALAAILFHEATSKNGPYSRELRNWASNGALETPVTFEIAGQRQDVRVKPGTNDGFDVSCTDNMFEIRNVRIEPQRIAFSLENVDRSARYVFDGGTLLLDIGGRDYRLRNVLLDPPRAAAGGAADGRVIAPMNGRVSALETLVGAPVAAGQTLLVLEAMKMEHPVAAPVAGTVAEIAVAPGEQVAPGKLLIVITPQA